MTLSEFEALCRVTDSGCWEWLGPRGRDGRALYRPPFGRQTAANRYACNLATGGNLPSGHLVNHCGNALCVRFAPGHWEASAKSRRPPAPPRRNDTDLTAEEVEAFIYRYWRGATTTGLERYFRVTPMARRRLVAMAQAMPPRRVA